MKIFCSTNLQNVISLVLNQPLRVCCHTTVGYMAERVRALSVVAMIMWCNLRLRCCILGKTLHDNFFFTTNSIFSLQLTFFDKIFFNHAVFFVVVFRFICCFSRKISLTLYTRIHVGPKDAVYYFKTLKVLEHDAALCC